MSNCDQTSIIIAVGLQVILDYKSNTLQADHVCACSRLHSLLVIELALNSDIRF